MAAENAVVIEFYNPQVDDFLGEPPHYRLLKRRALKKYGYLVRMMLEQQGFVAVCVDGTSSAFVPDGVFARLPAFVRNWIAGLEVSAWARLNDLKGRVKVSRTADTSGERALLLMSYKGAAGRLARSRSELLKAPTVIAHLSHYFISTAEKAGNLALIPGVIVAGDVDLTKNAYFQRYFPWYRRPFLTLPFTVSDRFASRTPFEDRLPKAVATGTFHDLSLEARQWKYADYISFTGLTTYHPVRKLLDAHKAELVDEIDVWVSEFRPPAKAGSRLARLGQKISSAQTSYFAIDIVELYNQHRYAIVGEELSGAPGLGAFEAMACGCVLIAQAGYYDGWNLIPGVHYVEHDGSLEKIRGCVHALNGDPERAARIAAAGRDFVDAHFRDRTAFSLASERVAALMSD